MCWFIDEQEIFLTLPDILWNINIIINVKPGCCRASNKELSISRGCIYSLYFYTAYCYINRRLLMLIQTRST